MYGFIFDFHSIYGSNLHHFGDEGRRKSRFFHITLAFDAPVRGSRRNIAKMFGAEKTRMVGLPGGKKIEDMFSSVDRIPACAGQTSYDGIVRAMYTRRAVKVTNLNENFRQNS